MEQKYRTMRRTANIAALTLTTAAALTFMGCRQKMPMPHLEAEGTNLTAVASTYTGTNQQTHARSGGFWWYMLGRNSASTPSYNGGSSAGYASHVAESPAHPASSGSSVGSVSRGGFGSMGRAASFSSAS